MELNYFMCHNIVKGGLNCLTQHFQIKHGLTIKRGLQKGGFECGQNKCRRFYNYFSLKQHIVKIWRSDFSFTGLSRVGAVD